jgi:hypothetical protein
VSLKVQSEAKGPWEVAKVLEKALPW